MADITDLLSPRGQSAPQLDLSQFMPSSASPAPVPDPGNPIYAGLKSGTLGAISSFSGAVAAGAKALGFDQAAANAEANAQRFGQQAEDASRPDLERQGFTGGGISGALKYGAYRAAQFVPQAIGLGLGTVAGAEVLPEAATAGVLARAGAMAPEFLGGAGGALDEAGLAKGAALARNTIAGGFAMAPMSIGEQFNAASKQPGGGSQEDALKAIALGVPLGMIQSIGPHGAGGIVSSGLGHAAAFGIGSGLQTAADTSYDPSMTAGDRASAIVQSAVSGAALGGLFGAARGLIPGHPGEVNPQPNTITNDQLTASVEGVLSPQSAGGAAVPDMPTEPAPTLDSRFAARQQAMGIETPQAPTTAFDPSQAGPSSQDNDAYLDRIMSVIGKETPIDPSVQRGAPLPPDADAEALADRVRGIADRETPIDPNVQRGAANDDAPVERKQSSQELRDLYAKVTGRTVAEATPADLSPQDAANLHAAVGEGDVTSPPPEDTRDPIEQHIDATDDSAKRDLFETFGDMGNEISARSPMRAWIDNSTATTEPELYNQLKDELDSGSKVSKSMSFKRMAQEVGLLNDDFKPLDLDQERAALADIPNAGARAAEASRLDSIEQRQQEAEQLRAQPDVSVAGTGDLDEDGGWKPGSLNPEMEPEAMIARDQARIKQMYPGVERRMGGDLPEGAVEQRVASDDAPEVPKSIAERVSDAAHEITGGTGGEASIADIRAKLPDVAPKDVDAALREIHGDDSDDTLTKNEKGQRSGDGVSVPGQGRFHNLSVEPREGVTSNAVQERSPAAVDEGQQAGPVRGDGTRDQPAQAAASPVATQARGEVTQPTRTDGEATVDQMRQRNEGALQRPVESVDANGATTLPSDAIGTRLQDVANSLRERSDRLMDADENPPIVAKTPMSGDGADAVMSREAAKKAFEDATSSLAPEYRSKVHLIFDAKDLPSDIHDAASANGWNMDNALGWSYNGEAYVRGDLATSPARLQETVSHEVFGHIGTLSQLESRGDAYALSLDKAFNDAGGVEGLKKIAEKLKVWDRPDGGGLKHYVSDGNFSPSSLMDELIAHAADESVLPRERRAALAMIGRVKEAIANMLEKAGLKDFAQQFRGFGAPELAKWLDDSRRILEGQKPADKIDLASLPGDRARFIKGDTGPLPQLRGDRPIREQLKDSGALMKTVGGVMDRIAHTPISDIPRKLWNTTLGFKTTQDFVRSFDKMFDGRLGEYYKANQLGDIINARIDGKNVVTDRALINLRKNFRSTYDAYVDMVHRAALAKVDPTRPWAEQTWLRDDPQFEGLKNLHAELHATWNKFGQPAKGIEAGMVQKLYRDQQAALKSDQYAKNIASLHATVETLESGLKGFETHPVKDYTTLNQTPGFEKVHSDANQTFAYFSKALTERTQALAAHLQGAEQSLKTQALASILDRVNTSIEGMQRYPYAHFGRDGDFFVSARLARGEGGLQATPDAVAALTKLARDVGMGDISFNTISSNRDVFVRFPTESVATKFREGLEGLSQHLDPDKEPRSGKVNSASDIGPTASPELKLVMDMVAEKLKDNPDAQKAALDTLAGVWHDSLPQDASIKQQLRREDVQGFTSDMVKNNAYRNKVAANAIGRLTVARDLAEHTADIMKQQRDATLGPRTSDNITKQDVGQAFIDRNAAQATRVESGVWNSLRGYAHSFYLAGSPGYVIMQLTQNYTLTLPELARYHGFARSMAGMTQAIPEVGHVLRAMAVMKGRQFAAIARGEPTDIVDGITPEVLDLAKSYGLSKGTADFLTRMDNMGKLEMGTFTHDNTKAFESSPANLPIRAIQMFNSSATMAELSARLVSAISSKRMYDGLDANSSVKSRIDKLHSNGDNYAAHVISESMYDWGGSATSKNFSKAGPLGAASPVAFQFHGFATRLFNKLTNETYNAIKGDTPEMRKEAQKFMMAHLGAVISLSGAMGLPMAGWAAAAATRASTLIPGSGGEAYDVSAHFRDFLASILGKSAGEALAHGLPRFMNADFSDLGDKDLLPMQSLLEDRRKLEDSVPDYLAHAWGSSIGAGVNMLAGARDISNGRILPGLARVMPTAIKNVVKAYTIGERGYQDSQGRAMPISATAGDVIRQALGVASGDLSEEREKDTAIQGQKEDRKYHSGVIKQAIARSLESGDQDGYQKWMQEAAAYDQDPSHQGALITPTIPAYLASRRRAVAYSQSSGQPVGVNPRDLPAANLVNF